MEKNALVESTVKFAWLDWQLEIPMERDFECLSLENLLNHDVLKMLKLCLVDTALNINVGCLESFSKIGYMSLIENLQYLRER